MARLQDFYKAEVAPALMKKFNYKSPMQIPRFDKIVINVGAGEAKDNAKVIDAIIADVTAITGQKAVPTHAKKAVANFKIRQVLRLLSAARECTSSWTDFSTWRCPAFVTSRVSTPMHLTVAATIRSV